MILSEADVASVLDSDTALKVVRAAFDAVRSGEARDLRKTRVELDGTTLHTIGAVFAGGLPGAPWAGAKVYVSGAGHAHWVLVFGADGLRALVSATGLGRLRTGAATGVSVDLLAPPEASSLGLLGAGRQAWAQVCFVSAVRALDRVTVWSRGLERARILAQRITTELGIEATPTVDPSQAVRGHDIVVAISKAAEPIVCGRDVGDRTHVVLAGSSHAQRREADADLFARAAAVYVDDVDVAREHSGDLRAAVAAGALEWSTVELVGAAAAGVPAGITVFKSHGMGSWDLSLAVAALDRAQRAGVGTEVG